MKTEYTAGPWHADFQKISEVKADNGALIARCNKLTSLTNLQANARLIAAAPELLEALEAMKSSFHGVEWMEPLMQQASAMARAAIAKATGRPA